MGGGRPLEVPLASMGISCRGAVIVRTSPRVDKGQKKAGAPLEPRLFLCSEFPRIECMKLSEKGLSYSSSVDLASVRSAQEAIEWSERLRCRTP